MLDHYIYGSCNRISPEAPVPVVEVQKEEYTLGGAGNVLKNLKALGCSSDIVTVVGADANADLVKTHLTELGTNNSKIIEDSQRCTIIKTRVMVSSHQLIRLDREDVNPISEPVAQTILNAIEAEIRNYDLVLISDYGKGALSNTLLTGIFDICKRAEIKTLLDPKGTDFSKYRGVNIIKPNKKEAIIASGIIINDLPSLKAACEKLQEITECDDVIITMSEDGIALYSNNELSVISTKALDVVDVTGAGDTVLASLGVALICGNSLYEACNFANHAAAVVVSKVGSATATLQEISETFAK